MLVSTPRPLGESSATQQAKQHAGHDVNASRLRDFWQCIKIAERATQSEEIDSETPKSLSLSFYFLLSTFQWAGLLLREPQPCAWVYVSLYIRHPQLKPPVSIIILYPCFYYIKNTLPDPTTEKQFLFRFQFFFLLLLAIDNLLLQRKRRKKKNQNGRPPRAWAVLWFFACARFIFIGRSMKSSIKTAHSKPHCSLQG